MIQYKVAPKIYLHSRNTIRKRCKRYAFDLKSIKIQTDNESEFTNKYIKTKKILATTYFRFHYLRR